MTFRNIVTAFVILILAGCGSSGTEPGMENLPRVSISNFTLFEGNDVTNFTFNVSLNLVSDKEVRVDYATKDDTAEKGTDYQETNGTVTIAAGERGAEIQIEIITDDLKEPDENFKVILSNAVNAEIANGEGIGTIRNDDTRVDIPEDGYITPESYAGYRLNWSDEFEGNEINTENWTHEFGASGWGNQESQYYTDRPDNSFVQDGRLVIEAKRENFDGAPYTSARMITKEKQTFTFGRVDIRATLPEGQGIWPALWMLGSNISTIGWPACGEIDIMELVGHEPDIVHGTGHWGEQGQVPSDRRGGDYKLPRGEKFSDQFHVFSIIWEPGQIEWYVDDNKYFTLRTSDVNGNYPFDNEFFFIFNIAVGGQWPGYPDATTQFPQRMIVDYIRVFDRI